jgi:hypothetical protein
MYTELTLREERRLKIFKNRVLRRTLDLRRKRGVEKTA